MAYFSITELSNRLTIPRKTIETAIHRNKLKGHKSPEGSWLIEERDALEYFNTSLSPEWISFQNVASFFHIPIEKLFYLRDESDIETKKFKGEIHVRVNEIYPTLIAVGLTKDYKRDIHYRNTLCFKTSFKLQNSKGLHLRPSVSICNLAKSHYPETRIELTYNNISWEFHPSGTVCDLLALKIPCGGNIILKTWGTEKKGLAKEVIDLAQKTFNA